MNGMTRRSHRGFTLIEACIWLAVSVIVVPVVVNLLYQVVRLTRRDFTMQMEVRETAGSLTWILRDLRSSSHFMVGNMLLNGGFEEAASPSQPRYWPADLNPPAWAQLYFGTNNNAVKSGFSGVGMKVPAAGQATYDSSHFMTLTPGAAYMITGHMKQTHPDNVGRVALIDQSSNVVASSQSTQGGSWHSFAFRYPAAGLYTDGMVSGNKVKIRLSVTGAVGGTHDQWAYFDDIACTPMHAVLLSTNPAQVNIQNTVTDPHDPAESTGFRFARWESDALELYRYRAAKGATGAYLVREKWNRGASEWMTSGPPKIGTGVDVFMLSYYQDSVLTGAGKNKPVSIYYAFDPAEPLNKTVAKPLSP